MKIPSLVQLERALHLRGAIETLQSELAGLIGGLADAVAPSPTEETEHKPPFADSEDGARRTRRRNRSREKGLVESPSAALEAGQRGRKSRVAKAQKARLKSLATGGEVGSAPVATEPKSQGRKTKRTKKRTMSAAGRARIAAAQKARWAKIRKGKK